MANQRAQINSQLFGQLASIYSQMGRGVPSRPGWASGGKGAYTNWLQSEIRNAQGLLANYQMQQQQQAMMQQQQQAQQAMMQAQQKSIAAMQAASGMSSTNLKSTLKSDGSVRGARSVTQRRAQQEGVRAANVLQSSQYISPTGGGLTSKPYGSSINLA